MYNQNLFAMIDFSFLQTALCYILFTEYKLLKLSAVVKGITDWVGPDSCIQRLTVGQYRL